MQSASVSRFSKENHLLLHYNTNEGGKSRVFQILFNKKVFFITKIFLFLLQEIGAIQSEPIRGVPF